MIPLVLALLAAPPAAAAPLPPAKPGWTVDWGETRCSLAREGQPAMALQIIPGTTEIQLYLFDTSWRTPPVPHDADAALLFHPGDTKVVAPAGMAKAKDVRVGVRLNRLERPFLDQFAAAESLAIQSKGREVTQIAIPGAAKAIAALRECEASALKEWGLDATKMMSLRSYANPTGGYFAWIHDSDYPDKAIHNGESGTVVALLKVGADGHAIGCAVIDSSGSKELDEQTCAIYGRRAKWDPAIDADGNPTQGLGAVRVRWMLPTS
jgi:TonB family protein